VQHPRLGPRLVSESVTGDAIGVVAATTLASGVEFVEALTIVLAMGTTRGWRSTWAGVGAALAALAVITALAGYAIQSWLPEALLQLVVGTLLLIFGLQWLRKAILRSAGLKPLHDEEDAFASEVQAAREAGEERRLGLDWFAFVVSFKGVFLEGLEIVFIVITFGLNADSIWLAVLGAAIGGTIVLAAGIALHKPLARVPENTIKFVVGLLLSTFGTFWAVEGLGSFAPGDASLEWPGGDLALLVLLGLWCALALATVRLLSPRSREVA
jgi:Ca2+/H+ antiporter, TMEM165/GDT1 family